MNVVTYIRTCSLQLADRCYYYVNIKNTQINMCPDQCDITPIDFVAILPKEMQYNDNIVVTGKLNSVKEYFMISFVNHVPHFFTYQFLWKLKEQKIVESYKENGQCITNDTENINCDEDFNLRFIFSEELIMVYSKGNNGITLWQHKYFDYSAIKAVRISGDVEIVKGISFIYVPEN